MPNPQRQLPGDSQTAPGPSIQRTEEILEWGCQTALLLGASPMPLPDAAAAAAQHLNSLRPGVGIHLVMWRAEPPVALAIASAAKGTPRPACTTRIISVQAAKSPHFRPGITPPHIIQKHHMNSKSPLCSPHRVMAPYYAYSHERASSPD